MNIAYLISAHTDAPQLKRLIEALHSDAEFFIHIDSKSDLSAFTEQIVSPRVHFIEKRVDVVWGTLTEVDYQMNLIRAAVRFPRHFHRIFFLSGMDFPLWSPQRITEWIEEQKDQETLQGYCMDTPLLSAGQRESYTVPRPFRRNRRWAAFLRRASRFFGIRKELHFEMNGLPWKLYKGSAWWCISEELADYVQSIYEHEESIHRYFRDSFCPAETVIQTIAFNTPQWADKCILTEGEYPGLAALTPLHFIDYDPVIRVLDETDYDRLMESGKMFCRKVVSGKSDHLVQQIVMHNS